MKRHDMARLFAARGLAQLPRVLGLTDREAASPTRGCADRTYWHYRLIDFPNARFQEAGWLFALAMRCRLEGNRFAESQALAQWARQGWSFWLDRRNGDGSVAELYPRERCFCATAFSAAAFCETVALLGGAAAWQDEIARSASTFVWLGSRSDAAPANQMAASWHALAGFACLTGDRAAAAAAAAARDRLLSLAQADGTLTEYGGFDSGYQSITLSTLCAIAALCPDDGGLADLIDRARTRLAAAIDAAGRTDPAANSRGTQYVYPRGLAATGDESLIRLAAAIARDDVVQPAWMDDRYCIAFAIDYLLAAEELQRC
jgi:hypothetical protein